jgi:hypothetical protein
VLFQPLTLELSSDFAVIPLECSSYWIPSVVFSLENDHSAWTE